VNFRCIPGGRAPRPKSGKALKHQRKSLTIHENPLIGPVA
jgi:hypothetical protein